MTFTEHIHKTYLFSDLNQDELNQLEQHSTEVSYAKGDTIYKQGSYSTHAIYLLEGYATIYQEINVGKRIVKIIKPGWFIGLMSVFSYEKHLFSAMASEACVVRMIEKNQISLLIETNPKFALKMVQELSLLGSSLVQYLVTQNTKNVRGRIAEILLHLSENIYKSTEFEFIFTRKELGALANTSTETAIRIINDFKNEKIIGFNEKKIIISNIDQLKKVLELG